jgi:2-C-methyl-D-erythritol 2,4-cyclodiphosphate synthase
MDIHSMRIGKGFDIHRLETGFPFMLGGIRIKHDKGCEAHSDGDVLIHALIDSLLGAVSMGDIGMHFPDDDPRFTNIASVVLLEETLVLIPELQIIHIDMTVFCEKPKLGPYREDIEESLAGMLGIEKEKVNLKFKTMEKTGEIGSGNAVAADAINLLLIKGDASSD